jgi:hypothetical protein
MSFKTSAHPLGVQAEEHVAALFRARKWKVDQRPALEDDMADMIIEKGGRRFVVEVKSSSEARPDRVIPQLSLAALQARASAQNSAGSMALTVGHIPHLSSSLIEQVENFSQRYADIAAVGVTSDDGGSYFRGLGLDDLTNIPETSYRRATTSLPKAVNLFSDLNQWMLKVLLAPDIPGELLHAPRRQLRNGTDLAEAAQVSAMSASRLLQQLRIEGYLDDATSQLRLVRREDLFRRWSASASRGYVDFPCRYLLRANPREQLRSLFKKHSDTACLGLFAAANELGIGHVSGVPDHVYVTELPGDKNRSGLMSAAPNDRPDLTLRMAPFPASIFRGAVDRDGLKVADIVQVWLDVAQHPTRGAEQADLIYRKVLKPIVGS